MKFKPLPASPGFVCGRKPGTWEFIDTPGYTAEQYRAGQLEAARDALEEAAKAMDISGSTVWGVVAGDRVRAIQLEQP